MMGDVFLKMDMIEGESLDPDHKGEIDVLSFSWSENNPASLVGGGASTGRVSMNDLTVEMPVNKASPKLFLSCANGQLIKAAMLTIRKPGAHREYFLKWTFSDVVVTSYGTAFNPGDQKPTDHFTLNFKKIEIEYIEIRPDGTHGQPIKAGWGVVAIRPL